MSIEELVKDTDSKEILSNLDKIVVELKNITLPLQRILNPEIKKKEEIFDQIKELRIKTEDIVKLMEGAKNSHDLKLIRNITSNIKEIVLEKERLKEELRNLGSKNKFM